MRILISFLMVASLTFTGCDETRRVIDTAGSVQLSGSYDITMAGNQRGAGGTITFKALDKSVSGNSGCNTFFGNYTLDLYVMDFGEIAVTKKMCDAPIMDREQAILDALEDTGSYSLEGDVLTLLSKTDRTPLLRATKIKPQN